MAASSSAPVARGASARKPWRKQLAQVLTLVVTLDAILLLVAGRWDWMGAWILSGLYLGFVLLVVVWAARHSPQLLEERSRMAANVKRWDKIIMAIYALALVALLVVAAWDAGRARWSKMPWAVQAAGVLGFIVCAIWLFWVTKTNVYLSRFARIQSDRDQQVVTTGPYRFVRHPMYAALILFTFCLTLVLGSWCALVPAAVIAVLLVIRTALEDGMLQRELAGYTEYAQRVRYRLLPGVW
jgi:protein-S-isoprenylcysteine O-methyltransferase Ste14